MLMGQILKPLHCFHAVIVQALISLEWQGKHEYEHQYAAQYFMGFLVSAFKNILP